ncbi:hypothetical protein FA15DRAFT_663791 [Coprinopsis marcescibilis]|uniref:DUF6593 domain-containing protein n=1 Tax=Coprinopsis marcescibilis TaxID=230819 RepID=A0A5C3LA44_COPMA|nr:hypothetical protein FA15DRAFT_663791 [Coprinopsis marcescibilis]
MSKPDSVILCLVDNDPTATLLITSTGEPLYAIRTQRSHPNSTKETASPIAQPHATTTVCRLDRYQFTTGQVETEIGVIRLDGLRDGLGLVHLRLDSNHLLEIGHAAPKLIERHDTTTPEPEPGTDSLTVHDHSWTFTGPDKKQYIWQMFIQSPVLVLADQSFVPLARYRRAKIGIVSRPRKASLEVFPPGIGLMDMVVVTFVAFMRFRVPTDLHAVEVLEG